MDNQQEPTVRHREACSLLCGSLDGGSLGEQRIHLYIWLSPFAVHLKVSEHWWLIGYAPIQNLKLFFKKKNKAEKEDNRCWRRKEYDRANSKSDVLRSGNVWCGPYEQGGQSGQKEKREEEATLHEVGGVLAGVAGRSWGGFSHCRHPLTGLG